MKTLVNVLPWVLLGLSLFSLISCLISLGLASWYRRWQPNHFAKAAWIWAGACLVFFIACPLFGIYEQFCVIDPLVAASGSNKLATVKGSLRAGVDVNATDAEHDDDGETALIAAAGHGHTEMVRYLLSQGANPNQSAYYWLDDNAGRTFLSPLEAAKKYPEIIKLLRSAGAK